MRALPLLLLFVGLALANAQNEDEGYTEKAIIMGMAFEVKAVSNDYGRAYKAVKLAINEARRIDTLLSTYLPQSEASQINKYASIKPVQVSSEIIQLILRSKKISRITNGAFDISYAVLSPFWRYDSTMKVLPNPDTIKHYQKLIGYENIIIDIEKNTIKFAKPGMRIGFGGIGQGYAAEQCKKVMQNAGIKCGYVNVSGDIRFWGTRPDGKLWRVAFVSPDNKKEVIAWLDITDASVVTSGDYEQFAIIDGKRYTHIFDPRTGYPANTMRSVAIISPDTEVADGLSTGTFVLGETKGLELINNLKNIECLMVTNDNRIVTSEGLKINFTPVNGVSLYNK
jgi:thiamine biosynthesis lipoprotein